MKTWQQILLIFFLGLAALAAIFIAAKPVRGKPVEILPIPTPGPMTVYLSGAIRTPGVYTLPPESRLTDAIQAAGGMENNADPASVNLAVHLTDEMHIHIPTLRPTQNEGETQSSSREPTPSPQNPLDINTATLEQLDTLPGIGAERAQDIIDYRKSIGKFSLLEQLLDIPGIGDATLEKLKPLLCIDCDK